MKYIVTVTDNMDDNISCNLIIDETVASSVNASNGSLTNITVTNINHGAHYWYVNCTDEAGNSNISESRNFTTNLYGAIIQLISPLSPNNWDGDGNVVTANNGILLLGQN